MNRQEIVTLLQMQRGLLTLIKVVIVTETEVPEYATAPPPPGQRRRTDLDQAPRPYPYPLTYKCMLVTSPAIGDLVVVEYKHGFAIANVVEVGLTELPANLAFEELRHVVTRVDLSGLMAIHRDEAQIRQQLAMAEINNRLKQVQNLYGTDFTAMLTPPAMTPMSGDNPPASEPPFYPQGHGRSAPSMEPEKKEALTYLKYDTEGKVPPSGMIGMQIRHQGNKKLYIITGFCWLGATDQWAFLHSEWSPLGVAGIQIARPLSHLEGVMSNGEGRYSFEAWPQGAI